MTSARRPARSPRWSRIAAACVALAAAVIAVAATLTLAQGQAGAALTVTQADNGRTIALRTDDRFLLQLGDTLDWTVTVSDPSVLQRVPNILVVRGAQGVYKASGPGETTLTATGVPICKPGEPCPQLVALFRLHISVRASFEHRALVAGLAMDGSDGATVALLGTVLAGPTCPVETIPPDPRCADRAVAGAHIIITDDSANQVAEAVSAADGTFEVVLAPGIYTLRPQPVAGLLGTAPPQQVVVANDNVSVTLHYDTGIR